MDRDNLVRNLVFGGAIAAIVAVSAVSDNIFDYDSGDDNRVNVRVSDDDYDREDYNNGERGDRVNETRDFAAFSKIEVRGAVELDLEIGDTQSVNISAYEKHMGKIDTHVEGDTLVIDMTKQKSKRFWRNADLQMTMVLSKFTAIDVRGAIDGKLSGLSGQDIIIDIAGAADLKMQGNCKSMQIKISGAADISSRKLECDDVDVRVDGAGDVSVFARKSVDIKLSGVGDIDVYGNPKEVNKHKGGFGSIDIHSD